MFMASNCHFAAILLLDFLETEYILSFFRWKGFCFVETFSSTTEDRITNTFKADNNEWISITVFFLTKTPFQFNTH